MSQEKDITQKFLCKKEDHTPRYFTLQQLEAMDSASEGYSWDGWYIVEEPKVPAEIADFKPETTDSDPSDKDLTGEGENEKSSEQDSDSILGIPPVERPKKAQKQKKPADHVEKAEKPETTDSEGVDDVTKTDTDNATDREEQESGERNDNSSESQEGESAA